MMIEEMRRKLNGLTLPFVIAFAVIFSGCGTKEAPAPAESAAPSSSATTEIAAPSSSATIETSAPSAVAETSAPTAQDTDKSTVILTVGDSTFSVVLYDNNTAAAKAFH